MENEEKRTGLFEKIFAKGDLAETRRGILQKFKERRRPRKTTKSSGGSFMR